MKILTVVGARPQFIKASVLSAELASRDCVECLVHTGQHYDDNMSKVFFEGLDLKEPDHYLEVGSASHAVQTGNMMARLEPIVESEHPDLVLVYGDTNTTLAGALVAAKLRLPLGHVEAGLRSYNRHMPEEINRIVADHIATKLFAPSLSAVENLTREGVTSDVHFVGDLMVDLVRATARSLPDRPTVLRRFGLTSGTFGVATVHRASNTDDSAAFQSILEGLSRSGLPILFPVHPRTRPLFEATNARLKHNIIACEPLSYADVIALQKHARVILTDSGGIQKEALTLEVPCVTLRSETEWTETLEHGWNVLAGSDPALIAASAVRSRPTVHPFSHYGDGTTAQRIADVLVRTSNAQRAIA